MKHRWLIGLSMLVCASFAADAKSPSYAEHKAFLLQQWDPSKPSLIAFKDPRCPYCIKSLQKRERLDNYNVFLFWAPILGPGSQAQVERFFHCETPTNSEVLMAVTLRKYPLCAGSRNEDLRRVNDAMVDAYKPNSVPQYWYGGRRVALAQLNLALPKSERLQLLAQNSPLKIQWDRYQSHAVNPPLKDILTIGVVLPDKAIINENALTIMRQDSDINWYVFDNENVNSKSSVEFRMLTNLFTVSKATLVVEGKILTEKQRKSLIDKKLQQHLFSS